MSQVVGYVYEHPRINSITQRPALCYSCGKESDENVGHMYEDQMKCSKIWELLNHDARIKRRNCHKHNEFAYGGGRCTCDLGNGVKLLWR